MRFPHMLEEIGLVDTTPVGNFEAGRPSPMVARPGLWMHEDATTSATSRMAVSPVRTTKGSTNGVEAAAANQKSYMDSRWARHRNDRPAVPHD